MARLDYYAPGVYVEEVSRGSKAIEGVSLSVAGFVGFTEDIRGDAEIFEPMLVTSWSQYLEYFGKLGSDGFTDPEFGAYLPFAVQGWFDNGGGRCWVVSIGTQLPKEPEPNTPVEDTVTLVKTSGRKPSLAFRIKPDKVGEGRLKVSIESDEPRPSNTDEEPFDTGEYFRIRVFKGKEELETFEHLTMQPPENSEAAGDYVLTRLRDSEWLTLEIQAQSNALALAQRPANGVYEVSPPRTSYTADRWYQHTYGNRKNRKGIQGLFEIDEVAMIACPDLMLAYRKGLLDLDQVHAVMEMMLTGCENSAPSPPYRMVAFDAPPVKPRRGDEPINPDQCKPQDIYEWMTERWGRRSQFAALYYPWIQVADPRQAGKPIYVPPSGHMLGIWCQTDETRGIYKAPANVVPRGVLGLAYDTNFREQELLNPKGINCIRRFRDRGTLVWGARTIADPNNEIEWRYISVRRLMSYISKSIELGTQWAVFEPNDEDLWARVKRTINNFLERLWREGALFGATPEQAFYVKCDAELNTPDTMMLGRLYVEIGVCPVRPAEFVIFRISQWTGQGE